MRTLLPLLSTNPHGGGRSALTCRYRCGDACFHEVPNTSDNEYAGDLIAGVLSRRSALRAAAVVTVASAVGGAAVLGEAPAAEAHGGHGHQPAKADGARGLRFTPVAPNTADKVTVPAGYSQNVVIRWGEPILRGAPAFDAEKQSAKAQAGQFGYNNDFLSLLPLPGERDRQVLVANHEYTDEVLMFRGYDPANPTREQVETAWAAHGLSVVVVQEERRTGRLTPVSRHHLNRRLHTTSEFRVTGPAAGSDLLKTSADPAGRTVLGTLNNCAGGTTPWGTTLHGEENFNQYFANGSSATDKRYGVGTGPTERKWERFDKRFDLRQEPNEVHRFGWVVELDPYDPDSTPRKRTALGRFKHEAAQPRLTADGRPVVYMGDDERFDYFYKFVSSKRMKKGSSRAAREHNLTLLDEGTLYVAKLTGDSPAAEVDGTGKLPNDGEFDGSGVWIPLATGNVSHVPGMTAEEVYVFTRLAGDKVGATKMDRPEDVEPSPAPAACTSRSPTTPTAARPARRARTRPTRATSTSTGRSWSSPSTGTTRPRTASPGACLRRGRPGRPGDLLRRLPQGEGLPDLLPGQRRLRPARQPVDLHRRQPARLARRPVRRRRAGRAARGAEAVPDRADRRRDLWPARPGPARARRRAAPGRGRRRVRREARVDLARRPREDRPPSVVAVWRTDGGDIGV